MTLVSLIAGALLAPVVPNVNAIAWAPDLKQIVVGYETGLVRIYDLAKNKWVQETEVDNAIKCFAMSKEGDHLAVGGSDGLTILLLRLRGSLSEMLGSNYGPEWVKGSRGGDVSSVAFSADENWLASTTMPGNLAVVRQVGSTIRRLTFYLRGNGMSGAAFVDNDKLLITGGQTLAVWDFEKAKRSREFEPSELTDDQLETRSKPFILHNPIVGWTTSLAIVPGTNFVATTSVYGAEDQGRPLSTLLVDPRQGKVVKLMGKAKEHLAAICASPDGKFVASGGDEGQVLIYDVATGQLAQTFKPEVGAIAAIAYSPRGDRIAVGGSEKSAVILDAATGKRTTVLN